MNRYIGLLKVSLLLLLCLYPVLFASAADSEQATTIHTLRYFDQPIIPDLYLVRPGDKILITFIEASIASITMEVDSEGRLVRQSIGVITAAGKTLSEVRAELLERLQEIYQAKEIVVSLAEPTPVAISVIGYVSRPGTYVGNAWQSVSEIIDSAGGLLPNGSKRQIKFSGGAKELIVDLQSHSRLADQLLDPPLYAGKTIIVPEASKQRVLVVGGVNQPGSYELLDQDSILGVINLAGGLIAEQFRDRIEVIRGGDRLSDMSIKLIDGDIISVPSGDQDRNTMLSIYGAVKNSGRYSFDQNQTVTELLESAGGVTSDANISRAALYRRPAIDDWQASRDERFLLHLFLRTNSTEEVRLAEGDSLFIPFKKGYVRISGDVFQPGLYPYMDDKTIGFYLETTGIEKREETELSILLVHPATGFRVTANEGTFVYDGDHIIVSLTGVRK